MIISPAIHIIRVSLTVTLCLTLLFPTMAVESGKNIRAGAQAQPDKGVQAVKIRLTSKGYEPKSFTLKRDVLARVTFVRETNETCGTEIVIQEYGIRKPLPPNRPVTVEFTPNKAGEFQFACGMGMLRGKIVVQ